MAVSIDALLRRARAQLARVEAADLEAALSAGAWLIDIRPEAQRSAEGAFPRAHIIERNVLEWRLDPQSSARITPGPAYDDQVIIACSAGYASSLAAATLQALGFRRATDLAGGYQAWRGLDVGMHGA